MAYIKPESDFFPIVFSHICQCMVVNKAFALPKMQGDLFGDQARFW